MSGTQVHIASVRLKDFLSFYDGTVAFDPGLTVIVGPNGSGKTSIFHALKFALGSNQRENRYTKWSDFVRHGASSAEVELILSADGQDRKLVRRIDRDGVPRSYVDGKHVKAAELRTLIESFGLEPDNPLVFMPQERINSLREMDPIEVRKLVEEGTGLFVARDRILLQETQVHHIRGNLESAIAESRAVEGEIGLLQHDLVRLEKKRGLLKVEGELDIEVKWAVLDDLVARIEKTRLEIESMESGIGRVIDGSRALETGMAQLEHRRAEAEGQLGNVQREIGAVEARIDDEERRLLRLEDDTKKKAAEVRQLEQHVSTEKRKKDRLTEDIAHASKAKEQSMEELRTLRHEIDETEKERVTIEDQLAAFSEWNAQRAEAFGDYRALQAEAQGKDVLLRSLKERLQVEEAELQTIETKWGHVWAVLEKADEKELTRSKSQLENELTTLNETRLRETSLAAQLQKETEDIRISMSETSKRVPQTVIELKHAVSEHGMKTVVGPLLESLAGEADMSLAVEAVLPGNMAFAFIASDYPDYTLLVRLRNKALAPSPIVLIRQDDTLPPNELPDLDGVEGWLWDRVTSDTAARELLRRAFGDIVLVASGRVAALVVIKTGLAAVSMDGYLTRFQQSVTISYPKCEPTGVISTAPLQTRLEKADKELTLVRKQLTDLMTKIEKAEKEREQVMDLLSQVTRWSGTWERKRVLSESIPQIEERVAGTDDQLKELQRRLGIAQTKLRKLDSAQPAERSRLAGQLSAVKIKTKRLQGDVTKAESSLHGIEKEEELKRQELRQLDESITMLSERLEEVREDLKQSKSEGSTILASVDELRSSRDQMAKTQTALKEILNEIRNSTRSMSEKLTELNLTIKNGRLQVIQAKRQLDNMEHEHQQINEATREQPRPERVRPVDDARAELIRIRHLLDEYQDVSESVAHTESKLKERMAELSSRVTDLREELDEAESTVKSIRGQYLTGMKEALSKLEKETERVLSGVQFTGKVRFELSLIDGEYGVDFRSRIRGESYDKLSAGSGGERSLIAIGLILALQRFNPGPVYALDEIDTFLDATNTELVSRLLYDSSRRSQFILFTPAKSTHLLRHADRRIGVVSPGGVEPSVIIESPSFSGQ